MKIASAQINCTVGGIQQNLEEHYRIIETAIDENIELITFPEMSITGYCREEGHKLAFTQNDSRLDRLKELSIKGNIVIVAGAPIRVKTDLYIGAFIIRPNKSIDIYTKQYLHDGEELFYSSSMDYNPIIKLGKERLSVAICADINNEKHPYHAAENETSIYLACIFYSNNGIDKGCEQLKNYAQNYSLNILMANYSGELWNMKSGGKSAFWNSKGELIENLNSNDSGLLVAEKKNEKWKAKKLVTTRN